VFRLGCAEEDGAVLWAVGKKDRRAADGLVLLCTSSFGFSFSFSFSVFFFSLLFSLLLVWPRVSSLRDFCC
jgi:hypothetical protein